MSLSVAGGRRTHIPSPLPAISPALHRLSLLTVGVTFFLIIAGALVVGNEAGLAVPDWPLSFGTWMPPMVGGVFYEHGHRLIAATVGFLTIILAFWLWRSEPRGWVRRLGWIAVLAVLVQGILGGVTVLYRLPTPIVVTHACLAQLFFLMTISLAVFTGRRWNQPDPGVPGVPGVDDGQSSAFRQLAAATSLLLFIQLVLGAALRHNAVGVIPHLLGAVLVCGLVGWVIQRAMTQLPEQQPLQRLAVLLGIFLILQVVLGGVSYFTRLPQNAASGVDPVMIWTTTAHVAVGALVFGTSWVLTLYSFRFLAPPRVAAALQQNPQKSPA